MTLYFDTAYIAKCYVNEPESGAVRELLRQSEGAHSANICIAELAAVFHRRVREKILTLKQAQTLQRDFFADIEAGVWSIVPMKEAALRRLAVKLTGLDPSVAIRAPDATHLWAASEAGFSEIWSNDRQLLAAAESFGLTPRQV